MNIPRFFTLLLVLSSAANAVVLTLGSSTQPVTYTGTGLNPNGAGTGVLSWGSCTYDGKNSTCTVSGTYTGLGDGGTYSFVLTYPGNGPSPLGASASPEGTDNLLFSLKVGSYVFNITPTNGQTITFYDISDNLTFDPTTDSCTGVARCAAGPVGDTSGATITGPLNGTFDTTPVISSPGGVLSATSYGGFSDIAPGTWIEIYGTNLGTTLRRVWLGSDFTDNGVQAPTSLGGTTVTVAGQPAYVDYVSPNQVDAQVPTGIATGQQPVVVTTAGGDSLAMMVNVNAVEPGLLAPPQFKLAAGQYAVALFPDGKTYVLPPGLVAGVATKRAKPGDTIMLYGIGFGPVTPNIDAGIVEQQSNALASFTISFAGTPAKVQFAGLVYGFVGLYQFNVVVPNIAASDTVPVTFTFDGTAGTQSLLLPIS